MMRHTCGSIVIPLVAAATLAGCNVRDVFHGSVDVAARAAGHDLTVAALAQTVAAGRNIPTERGVMARWTQRWVEFSLFAQRVAAGDSLLDSAAVMQVMWPGVYRAMVGAFHNRLVDERLDVARAVDSAYAAGELRLVRHILIRTRPDMTPAERLEAQRRAEAIWGRLVNGGSWTQANEQNEDPAAKERGGSLGVVRRGQTVPEFEAAAYALGPGEISRVTQSSFGFHILLRPTLEAVRQEYAAGIEPTLVQRMDSVYLVELEERWRIRVKAGAPPAMREAARMSYVAASSTQVLGTYRGGAFTVRDFVRWLQTRPAREQQLIPSADDEQLGEFARSLVRNEVLLREARQAGVGLHDSTFAELKRQLGESIGQLREALALDSALAGLIDPDLRQRAAREAADRHMERLAQDLQNAVLVQPSLAQYLKETAAWSVSYAGLEQARVRAQQLRAQGVLPPPALPEVSE